MEVTHARALLERLFVNPDELALAIYKNGGTKVSGWGYLSPGYGGGVEQGQALHLVWLDGYLSGTDCGGHAERHAILQALNTLMLASFPIEPNNPDRKPYERPPFNADNLPFVNLDEDLIRQGIAKIEAKHP